MKKKKLRKLLGLGIATSVLGASGGTDLPSENMREVYAQTSIAEDKGGDSFNPADERAVALYGVPVVEDTTEDSFNPAPTPDPVPEETLVVGSEYTDAEGKAIYKVIATGEKTEVSYIKPADKTITEVVIPDTIIINGITCKVMGISETAFREMKNLALVTIGDNIKAIPKETFKGCKKLENVTIGKNVTTIGENAFKNCKRIKTINIKTKKLKSGKIGKNAFKNVGSKNYKKVKVYVPSKKYLKKYKALLRKKGLSSKVKVTE